MSDAPFEQYQWLLADEDEAAWRAEYAERLKAWKSYCAALDQNHAMDLRAITKEHFV